MAHFHEQITCVIETAASALNAFDACIGRLDPRGVEAIAHSVDDFVELVPLAKRVSWAALHMVSLNAHPGNAVIFLLAFAQSTSLGIHPSCACWAIL